MKFIIKKFKYLSANSSEVIGDPPNDKRITAETAEEAIKKADEILALPNIGGVLVEDTENPGIHVYSKTKMR